MHFQRKSRDDKSRKALVSEQDPSAPTILCYIGNHKIERALLDLGSSGNVIPYYVYMELGFGELKPSKCILQLVNRLLRTPRRRVDDAFV